MRPRDKRLVEYARTLDQLGFSQVAVDLRDLLQEAQLLRDMRDVTDKALTEARAAIDRVRPRRRS